MQSKFFPPAFSEFRLYYQKMRTSRLSGDSNHNTSNLYHFDSSRVNEGFGEQRFIDINIDSEAEESTSTSLAVTRNKSASSSNNQSPTYKLNAGNLFKFGSSSSSKAASKPSKHDVNNNVSNHVSAQTSLNNSTGNGSSVTSSGLMQKTELLLANLNDVGINSR